jgi:hypothetical protein
LKLFFDSSSSTQVELAFFMESGCLAISFCIEICTSGVGFG